MVVLRQNLVRPSKQLISRVDICRVSLLMLRAVLLEIRFIVLMLGGHQHVALENAALRQQLAVFKRRVKRPKLRRRDRVFWTTLRMIWETRRPR